MSRCPASALHLARVAYLGGLEARLSRGQAIKLDVDLNLASESQAEVSAVLTFLDGTDCGKPLCPPRRVRGRGGQELGDRAGVSALVQTASHVTSVTFTNSRNPPPSRRGGRTDGRWRLSA